MDSLIVHLRYDLEIVAQALVALFLGGVLGWEREAAGKWAGLRTHMLVCLACAMFIRVGQILIEQSEFGTGVEALRMDPIRLIEAMVTGVAFLGAGTIFRDREGTKMRGLTTAASLLAVAPIGVAVALNRYLLAAAITLLVWIVLRILVRLETKPPLATKT